MQDFKTPTQRFLKPVFVVLVVVFITVLFLALVGGGFYFTLYGGIVQIVDAVQVNPVSGGGIAIGIIRIFLTSVVVSLAFLLWAGLTKLLTEAF